MATVQIETLSDELCQSIQQIATDRNISVSDAVIELLTPAPQLDPSFNQYAQLHQLIKDNTEYTPESLKDAILDAIERADPNYEPDMAEALAEAMAMADDTPSMDADEFREWLFTQHVSSVVG